VSKDKEFYTTFFSIMGGLAVFAILLVIIASNLTSDVSDYKPEEIVLENIKPVGQVYIAGVSEPEAAPAVDTVAAADGPKSGEEVYNGTCVSCHGTGAAGAPKFGDKAAWAPRIAKGNDALLSSVKNGLNAMPPKGTCMTCSDDDLRAAIAYMVEQGS